MGGEGVWGGVGGRKGRERARGARGGGLRRNKRRIRDVAVSSNAACVLMAVVVALCVVEGGGAGSGSLLMIGNSCSMCESGSRCVIYMIYIHI